MSVEEIQELYAAAGPPPPDVFYVDGVNGSDTNDGLTTETAFATIQKGIDTAEDGGKVVVYPGVYAEEVDFKGKAITVQSAADAAVIEAPAGDAVSFYYGEEPNSVLTNFIIRDSQRGIFIAGSSPTISNVTVVNNSGYGIAAYAGSNPDISNSIFWNNSDDLFGCEARYSWVQDEIGLMQGLVAHWGFDEGSGSTAYDSAGNNDGTIYGATWASGILDGALSFDGDNDYVQAGDDPVFDFTDEFTLSAWVKPTYSSLDGRIVYRYDTVSQDGYFLSEGDVGDGLWGFAVFVNSPEAAHVQSDSPPVPDTWTHIVGTRNSSGDCMLYINGVLQSDTETLAGTIDSNGDLFIGVDYALMKDFDGTLDEVMIFSRVLSVEEIQQLYYWDGLGPMFANANGGDYHLKSERGRYWPEFDVWVLDDVSSPCIDGGDPNADPSGEPMPNGGRINMGAYGGTVYASMSEWPVKSDINRDGVVNMLDLALLAEDWLKPSL